jgi:hypothetical protein
MNYYEYTPGGGGGGGSVTLISPIPLPVTSSAGSPVEITGSVYVLNPGGASSNVVVTNTPLPVTGTFEITQTIAGTGSFTSSNVSNTNTLVLATNLSRRGAMIFNTTSTVVLISYGFTATLSNYSVKLPANGMIEVPFNYCGAINAIASSVGPFTLNVTEFT